MWRVSGLSFGLLDACGRCEVALGVAQATAAVRAQGGAGGQDTHGAGHQVARRAAAAPVQGLEPGDLAAGTALGQAAAERVEHGHGHAAHVLAEHARGIGALQRREARRGFPALALEQEGQDQVAADAGELLAASLGLGRLEELDRGRGGAAAQGREAGCVARRDQGGAGRGIVCRELLDVLERSDGALVIAARAAPWRRAPWQS